MQRGSHKGRDGLSFCFGLQSMWHVGVRGVGIEGWLLSGGQQSPRIMVSLTEEGRSENTASTMW